MYPESISLCPWTVPLSASNTSQPSLLQGMSSEFLVMSSGLLLTLIDFVFFFFFLKNLGGASTSLEKLG